MAHQPLAPPDAKEVHVSVSESGFDEEVVDSPVGWVAGHIRTYVASGGAKGHRFRGHDALLLTTRGRTSGKRRRTALYYGRDGDRYLVVASNGGSARHPQWHLNLVADPWVEVQVGPRVFRARARLASAEERPALWRAMVALFPPYAEMQRRTRREIPVVIVEPLGVAAEGAAGEEEGRGGEGMELGHEG